MKRNHLLLSTLLALAAGGCAVGPNYHRPNITAPTHWSEPLAGGANHFAVCILEIDKGLAVEFGEQFFDARMKRILIAPIHCEDRILALAAIRLVHFTHAHKDVRQDFGIGP